jgi:hypothetical protein
MIPAMPKTGLKSRRQTKSIAMKKIFLAGFFITIFFVSWKKDNVGNKNFFQNGDLKIVSGHLAFKTKTDYETFLTMKYLKNVDRGSNFISLGERKKTNADGNDCQVPDSLIEDNRAFFSTLDAKGVVQIDSIIYRYDYCGDRVWVISAADANNPQYYADFMNGVERQNIVGYFPTYVDAIEAVAEGYKTMPDPSTVQGNEVFERFPDGITGDGNLEHMFIHNDPKSPRESQKFDGKISYDKFAIYIMNTYIDEKGRIILLQVPEL